MVQANHASPDSVGLLEEPTQSAHGPQLGICLVFCKGSWTLEGNKADSDITGEEFIKYSDAFWAIQPETRGRQPFLKSLYPPRNGRKAPEQKVDGHPAPFPEELIKRLVKFYSYRGNVVLDPFGGTGTVAAIAKRFGRHFVHMDISKKYSSIAAERVAAESIPLLDGTPTIDAIEQQAVRLVEDRPTTRKFLGRLRKKDPLPQ